MSRQRSDLDALVEQPSPSQFPRLRQNLRYMLAALTVSQVEELLEVPRTTAWRTQRGISDPADLQGVARALGVPLATLLLEDVSEHGIRPLSRPKSGLDDLARP